MIDLTSQLYPQYVYSGANNFTITGLKPESDYYAVAFGIDQTMGYYNSSLAKEPFTTLPPQPTDAFVEGHVDYWWSVYDLIEYNPSYSNLLRDSVKTMVAAVDLDFNEDAVECCFVLWEGDYSYMSYEDMYSFTQNAGQIVSKDDPATLIYVAPRTMSTLCSIAIDADGNYGDMDIEYNDTAVACCQILWEGDMSGYDYDELYSETLSNGTFSEKGDPASLFYVAFGMTSTITTIGIDADGNFGEMSRTLVTYEEEGKSMDFDLFQEYYDAQQGIF